MPGGRNTERLITLVVAAAIAFNYPLLYLFATDGFLFGIPLLFVYLFLTWFALIVLTALLMEGRRSGEDGRTTEKANTSND